MRISMLTSTGRLVAAVVVAGGVLLGACASAGGPAGGGGRRSSCPLQARDSVYLPGGPVYRDCAVDRKAQPIRPPRIDFQPTPGQLCYEADFELVVDSNGKPEPGTTRLVRTNSREYSDAVSRLLPTLEFRPAIRDGTAVRQIVVYKQVLTGVTHEVNIGGVPPPIAAAPQSSGCY